MTELPDILAEIIAHKRGELAAAKAACRPEELRSRAADAPPARDMVAALRREPGGPVKVIGEVKRKSPSAGLIRPDFDAARLACMLADAGVDAISVLTDERYFGGHLDFLATARGAVDVPLLRKDFIIDPWQVVEARAGGADAFLLIADALEASLLGELVGLGRELGMAALVESHDAEALERAAASGAELIGINNRDLRTFTVDLATTERLAPLVPAGRVIVGESGVGGGSDVSRLLAAGAHAVLVGESLMRAEDAAALVTALKSAR